MQTVKIPYGKDFLTFNIEKSGLKGIVVPPDFAAASRSPDDTIVSAMNTPFGEKLSTLAVEKNKVVIIASDHTRPVPSKYIIPKMLAEIREGNPDADITILIATGCHRETTKEELLEKFGNDIMNNEKIIVHDCDDNDCLVSLGTLPSGGELIINKLAAEADLLCAEGFIEPHFFAGFSGGRKSVLPGVASRKTVIYNHNAAFIAHENSRTGITDGNPIHKDMLFAAKAAKLAYIVNVVIDENKEPVFAVAGEPEAAHKAGCEFLRKKSRAPKCEADIVITSNGGYPLDQNIYQSVKGMTAGESCVKEGGVIIMASKCTDGHGGNSFYNTFKNEKNLNNLMEKFMSTPPDKTIIDQWQSQIFARVLLKADIVFISDAPDEIVKDLHMTPAHSPEEAMALAKDILRRKGNDAPDIAVIPDGVSVIIE